MTSPPFDVACVIPTHGRPLFLAEAVRSVLAQALPVAEIIIVSDDGDPASARVAEELAATSTLPIRFFARSEGLPGASASRNFGASASTSAYIAFLEDDDLWESAHIERSAALLSAGDVDFVASWLMMFRGSDTIPGLQMQPALHAHEVASVNPGFTGSNFVISRTMFELVGGFDEELAVINDGDLCYRLLLAGARYRVNTEFDVLQRKHELGQLTAATEMRARGLEQYMAKHQATLRRSDRRYLRLAASRIRWRASGRSVSGVPHLLVGILNSSPATVMTSIRGWRQRPFWHASPAKKKAAP